MTAVLSNIVAALAILSGVLVGVIFVSLFVSMLLKGVRERE